MLVVIFFFLVKLPNETGAATHYYCFQREKKRVTLTKMNACKVSDENPGWQIHPGEGDHQIKFFGSERAVETGTLIFLLHWVPVMAAALDLVSRHIVGKRCSLWSASHTVGEMGWGIRNRMQWHRTALLEDTVGSSDCHYILVWLTDWFARGSVSDQCSYCASVHTCTQ